MKNKNEKADKNFALKTDELSTGSDLKTSMLRVERNRLSKSVKTIRAVRNKLEVKERIIKLLSSNELKKLYESKVFANKYPMRIPDIFFLAELSLSL